MRFLEALREMDNGFAVKLPECIKPNDMYALPRKKVTSEITWRDKAEEEKTELEERLDKLVTFTNTSAFTELDQDHQFLLMDQLDAMRDYLGALVRRLELSAS